MAQAECDAAADKCPTGMSCNAKTRVCAPTCRTDNDCRKGELCDSREDTKPELGTCRLMTAGEATIAKLKTIEASADLALKPEDVKAGTFISPAINGDFEDWIAGNSTTLFRSVYQVHIHIQTPATNPVDAGDAAKRALLSGGDGGAAGQAKLGAYSDDRSKGLALSAGAEIAYTSPKTTGTAGSFVATTFGVGTVKVAVEAWLSVIYLGAQYTHRWAFGQSPGDLVASNMDNNNAFSFLLAAHYDRYFLQFRMLTSVDPLTPSPGNTPATRFTGDLALVIAFQPLK